MGLEEVCFLLDVLVGPSTSSGQTGRDVAQDWLKVPYSCLASCGHFDEGFDCLGVGRGAGYFKVVHPLEVQPELGGHP